MWESGECNILVNRRELITRTRDTDTICLSGNFYKLNSYNIDPGVNLEPDYKYYREYHKLVHPLN